MNRERFGSFIKSRREEVGLSRREVVEESGGVITLNTYKSWELGLYAPEKDKLFKLAELLRVSPGKLFEELEEPLPFEELPPNFITLPDDFPPEAQGHLESYAKFLQYEKEFDTFLKLAGPLVDRDPTEEELDDFARKFQETFSKSQHNDNGDRGRNGKDTVKKQLS
jgi:transcriptional regulator with XRE-family HTH domain